MFVDGIHQLEKLLAHSRPIGYKSPFRAGQE